MEFAQMPLDRELLIIRHWLVHQPGATADVEQIGVRTLRNQVRVQNRMHLILDPGPMPRCDIQQRDRGHCQAN